MEHSVVRFALWIGISLFVALLAYGFVRHQGVSYETHFSYLLVPVVHDRPAQTYDYDGYYALQASDLVGQSLEKWLTTSAIVNGAYKASHLTLAASDKQRLLTGVSAKHTAPQLVEVTVSSWAALASRRLAEALQQEIEKRPLFSPIQLRSTPLSDETAQPPTVAIVAATFIFSFLGCVNSWLLFKSLRPS